MRPKKQMSVCESLTANVLIEKFIDCHKNTLNFYITRHCVSGFKKKNSLDMKNEKERGERKRRKTKLL